MDYATLISLGIEFLKLFLSKTKAKLPEEVVTSLEASVVALEAHNDDVITKANLEAQRG